MSNIISFPKQNEKFLREHEEKILSKLQHPNIKVQERWHDLAKQSIRKYLKHPELTQTNFEFSVPGSVSKEQEQVMIESIKSFFESFRVDFEEHNLQMLFEIIMLQKMVAETDET